MATRFGALLRQVADGLEAPHPARLRILEELSSDLEDLYDTLRAEGLSERQARRQAAEILAPAPHASEALTHVHRPIWVRLVARFSDRTRNRAERALLAGLTLLVMASTLATLAGLGLLSDPSPFLAVVLVLAAVTAAASLGKTLQLYAFGEHRPQRIRAGLNGLLVAGCAALATAALGVLVGLASTAARIQADGALERELVLAWVQSSAGLVATALLVALGCAGTWMFFMRRAAVMEDVEAKLLDPGPGPLPESGGWIRSARLETATDSSRRPT